MNFKRVIYIGASQAAAAGIYFFALRPARALFGRWNLESGVLSVDALPLYVTEMARSGLSTDIHYIIQDTGYIFSYGPQFGFFFLLAVIGMLMFKAPPARYGALAVVHIVVEVLGNLGMYIGFRFSAAGFIAADFLIQYLSPLVSLGFVLYTYLEFKKSL